MTMHQVIETFQWHRYICMFFTVLTLTIFGIKILPPRPRNKFIVGGSRDSVVSSCSYKHLYFEEQADSRYSLENGSVFIEFSKIQQASIYRLSCLNDNLDR